MATSPRPLDRRLVQMLARQGIDESLYTPGPCPRACIRAVDTLWLSRPPLPARRFATTCPVLHSLLTDPRSRALYLFPTKALAYDQQHTLQAQMDILAEGLSCATYDGDTPSQRRSHVRATAHVVLSNPDMLHAGILPGPYTVARPVRPSPFCRARRSAPVPGNLWHTRCQCAAPAARICRFYGSRPQFICCSATIANPRDLAERLIGEPVAMVGDNGAPQGERNMVFCNPPMVNAEWGLRRSALQEARMIANRLLGHDVQTVVFARSRLSVELLVNMLRQDAAHAGRDPLSIRGYRSGYLASERREIERGLRCGRRALCRGH